MINVINTINNWYIDDDWYLDSPNFDMNYYNSFCYTSNACSYIGNNEKSKIKTLIKSKLALKRMKRLNNLNEKLISPEGNFPAFGSSIY